jgi:hypothetical protein
VRFSRPPFGDQLLGDLGLALQPGQPRLPVHPSHLLTGGQPAAHDPDDLSVGRRFLLQRLGRQQLQARAHLGPGHDGIGAGPARSARRTVTETSSGRTSNCVRQPHLARYGRYSGYMTVRDLLATLQRLPKDAELLAFEAGCEDYCEREVDEVEWQGGRVYLHLGARRENPRRR